jgi:hypothetical protein
MCCHSYLTLPSQGSSVEVKDTGKLLGDSHTPNTIFLAKAYELWQTRNRRQCVKSYRKELWFNIPTMGTDFLRRV